MNIKRDHIIEVLFHAFLLIKKAITFIISYVVFLFAFLKDHPVMMAFFLLLLSFTILSFSILQWYKKTFEITDKRIIIKAGVISTMNNEIPIENVQSFHESSNLLKRFFNIIDFNLELIGGEKVIFVLAEKDVADIRKIFSKQNVEESGVKEASYQFKIGGFRLFLLSLNLKTFGIAFTSSFLFVSTVLAPIIEALSGVNHYEQAPIPTIHKEDFTTFFDKETLVLLGTLLAILIIASCLISFLITFLQYKNYKVTKKKEAIYITNGLFETKTFMIKLSKVRSIKIIEPMLLRHFGYVQIKVENIGIDEKNLFIAPIIKKNDVNKLIKGYLADFKIDALLEIKKPPTPYYQLALAYCSTVSIMLAIIVGLLSQLLIWQLLFALLVIPVIIFQFQMKWHHSAVGVDEKLIYLRYYQFGKRVHFYVKKEFVQSTGTIENYFQRKVGLCTYYLSVASEQKTEVYCCSNVDLVGDERFLVGGWG